MSETFLLPWTPTEPRSLAPTAEPPEIVKRAVVLTERDQNAVVQAFQSGAFEMALTFIWSRAVAALKKQLSVLGMEFVGEMLGRTDLDQSSNPMTDIRDDEAIELAELLGMVTTTEALRLRTAHTLVNHFRRGSKGGDQEETKRRGARRIKVAKPTPTEAPSHGDCRTNDGELPVRVSRSPDFPYF